MGWGWVKKKKIKKDNCAICRKSLNSKLVYELDCGHQFHNDCINDYCEANAAGVADNNLTCPICRKAHTPNENDCMSVWAYKEKALWELSDVMVNKSLYVGKAKKRR
jgi:hypothetical protein